MIPFGKASVRHDGTDVLVVTWGALVQRSIVAAHQAEAAGISVAVLDLRTIAPYDWDGDRRARQAHQPGGRRPRGSADVRLRRRDRRADRRRSLRASRCAGPTCRRARYAGCLQPRARRRHPAADGRCPEGDSRDGEVLANHVARYIDDHPIGNRHIHRDLRLSRDRGVAGGARPRHHPLDRRIAPRDRRPFPGPGRFPAGRLRPVLRVRSPRSHGLRHRRRAGERLAGRGRSAPSRDGSSIRRRSPSRRTAPSSSPTHRMAGSVSRSSRRPASASAASRCASGWGRG